MLWYEFGVRFDFAQMFGILDPYFRSHFLDISITNIYGVL